jgi:hypothetical protein
MQETIKLVGLTRKNKELAKEYIASGKCKYVEIYTLKGYLRMLYRNAPYGGMCEIIDYLNY